MTEHDPNLRAGDRDKPRGCSPFSEIGLVIGILATLYVLATVMAL